VCVTTKIYKRTNEDCRRRQQPEEHQTSICDAIVNILIILLQFFFCLHVSWAFVDVSWEVMGVWVVVLDLLLEWLVLWWLRLG